jgi:hypothetical protein
VIKKLFQRDQRVDPSELDKQTEEVNAILERDDAKMNAIASYLEKRKNQNGFGTDFEFTLRPKEMY